MRKICSSANTACSLAFSETALARSVPNGFSMITRGPLDQPRLGQQADRRERRVGRHAQVVDPPALPAQRPLGGLDRGAQRRRPCGKPYVVEAHRELRPGDVGHGAVAERVERLAGDGAKPVGVDVVERDADDAAAGDEPGARQVEQARQELAPRQVAGGADQDDHLREARTDAWWNPAHRQPCRASSDHASGVAGTGRCRGPNRRAWPVRAPAAIRRGDVAVVRQRSTPGRARAPDEEAPLHGPP